MTKAEMLKILQGRVEGAQAHLDRLRAINDAVQVVAKRQEVVKAALDARDAALEALGGCGDGDCIIHIRPGMHTNGGCRCATDRYIMSSYSAVERRFAEAVRASFKIGKQGTDNA